MGLMANVAINPEFAFVQMDGQVCQACGSSTPKRKKTMVPHLDGRTNTEGKRLKYGTGQKTVH